MELNIIEVDARLNAVSQQRDSALNQVVQCAGRIAVLESELQVAQQALALSKNTEETADVLKFRDRQSMTEP